MLCLFVGFRRALRLSFPSTETHASVLLQGRPDVRMAFIQFALSFLVSGDHATVGQLLEMKGNALTCVMMYTNRCTFMCR